MLTVLSVKLGSCAASCAGNRPRDESTRLPSPPLKPTLTFKPTLTLKPTLKPKPTLESAAGAERAFMADGVPWPRFRLEIAS